ncbi:MAG: hypothetical protein AAF733_03695 [Verrucomicrobiota bacterium]
MRRSLPLILIYGLCGALVISFLWFTPLLGMIVKTNIPSGTMCFPSYGVSSWYRIRIYAADGKGRADAQEERKVFISDDVRKVPVHEMPTFFILDDKFSRVYLRREALIESGLDPENFTISFPDTVRVSFEADVPYSFLKRLCNMAFHRTRLLFPDGREVLIEG